MKTAITIALAAAVLAAAGCVSPQYAVPPPAQNADARTARMAALAEPYPAEFRIAQHIILSADGKEYDFTGYLAVKKGNGFRAMALGDMGGRMFDLVENDGKREILAKPELLPSGPLLDGVMGDIRHLFMVQREGSYVAAKRENGFSLISMGRDGLTEFMFSDDGGLLVSSLEVENGMPVREAAYSGYRLFNGWEKPLPARIVLVNRRWGYQLRIELLKIDVGPIDGRLLPNAGGKVQ